jgi:hypothetical protein
MTLSQNIPEAPWFYATVSQRCRSSEAGGLPSFDGLNAEPVTAPTITSLLIMMNAATSDQSIEKASDEIRTPIGYPTLLVHRPASR